jgi:hypothetical protein
VMRTSVSLILRLTLLAIASNLHAQGTSSISASWTDKSPHKEGFVTVNGVKLHFPDWGGTGEVLLFLDGWGGYGALL